MKRTYYITGIVALFLVAIYIIEKWLSPEPGFFLGTNNNNSNDNANTVVMPKAYNNLKNQVTLHKGTMSMYSNEIEVLQRFINVYPGVNPVPVTGVFDELTEAAVKQVTGKGVTTLQEFRYVWMVNKGLNLLADKIVKGQA